LARVARIVPLHIIGLLLATPLTLFGLQPDAAGRDLDIGSQAISWVSNLLLVHAWMPGAQWHYWNSPSWTLCCEAVMYALFPLIAVRLLRRVSTIAGLARLAFWSMILLVVSIVATNVITVSIWPADRPMWPASPLIGLWQFLLGTAVGAATIRGYRLRPVWAGAGIAALMAGWWFVVFVAPQTTAFVTTGPVSAGVCALVIAAVAGGVPGLTPLLGRPALVRLGKASYALYILHWPALLLLMAAGASDGGRALLNVADGLPVAVVIVGALVLGSMAAHVAIERPIRAWLMRPGRQQRPDAAGTTTMAASG
jgi:peptidoglycan/LPS O-acetylase OafA/YrhL